MERANSSSNFKGLDLKTNGFDLPSGSNDEPKVKRKIAAALPHEPSMRFSMDSRPSYSSIDIDKLLKDIQALKANVSTAVPVSTPPQEDHGSVGSNSTSSSAFGTQYQSYSSYIPSQGTSFKNYAGTSSNFQYSSYGQSTKGDPFVSNSISKEKTGDSFGKYELGSNYTQYNGGGAFVGYRMVKEQPSGQIQKTSGSGGLVGTFQEKIEPGFGAQSGKETNQNEAQWKNQVAKPPPNGYEETMASYNFPGYSGTTSYFLAENKQKDLVKGSGMPSGANGDASSNKGVPSPVVDAPKEQKEYSTKTYHDFYSYRYDESKKEGNEPPSKVQKISDSLSQTFGRPRQELEATGGQWTESPETKSTLKNSKGETVSQIKRNAFDTTNQFTQTEKEKRVEKAEKEVQVQKDSGTQGTQSFKLNAGETQTDRMDSVERWTSTETAKYCHIGTEAKPKQKTIDSLTELSGQEWVPVSKEKFERFTSLERELELEKAKANQAKGVLSSHEMQLGILRGKVEVYEQTIGSEQTRSKKHEEELREKSKIIKELEEKLTSQVFANESLRKELEYLEDQWQQTSHILQINLQRNEALERSMAIQDQNSKEKELRRIIEELESERKEHLRTIEEIKREKEEMELKIKETPVENLKEICVETMVSLKFQFLAYEDLTKMTANQLFQCLRDIGRAFRETPIDYDVVVSNPHASKIIDAMKMIEYHKEISKRDAMLRDLEDRLMNAYDEIHELKTQKSQLTESLVVDSQSHFYFLGRKTPRSENKQTPMGDTQPIERTELKEDEISGMEFEIGRIREAFATQQTRDDPVSNRGRLPPEEENKEEVGEAQEASVMKKPLRSLSHQVVVSEKTQVIQKPGSPRVGKQTEKEGLIDKRSQLPPIPDGLNGNLDEEGKKKRTRKRGKRRNKKGATSRDGKSDSGDGEGWMVAEKKPQKIMKNKSWVGPRLRFDKKENYFQKET